MSTHRLKMSKHKPVCGTCGSEDVRADAWAAWNIKAQCWELSETFDNAYCNNCDGECTLRETVIR